MTISLKNILRFIENEKYEIWGTEDLKINRVFPLEEAEMGDLSFCSYSGSIALEAIECSAASVVICGRNLKTDKIEISRKTLILVDDPRLVFIRVFEKFFVPKKPIEIHSTAIIGKDCDIGENVSIGEYTVIGNQVRIGNHSRISASVHIGDDIHIGKEVVIHVGAVIGTDGFSYQRDDSGQLVKFPHIGGVIIEDSVEIGANTCIDRGTMTNTVIGEGTKIDNLVHVAHNVQIGKHCVIVALSLIGGSTKIGDYSWIAPCACIRDRLSVGSRAIVGMGAVVTKDVEDETVVYGVPAIPKTKR